MNQVSRQGFFDYSVTGPIIRAAMSAERFETYLVYPSSAGDIEKACQLYTWNTAVSAAFYGPLQALEVTLRNAVHDALTRALGQNWYLNPLLREGDLAQVKDAIAKVEKQTAEATPGRVVAELSMGYWTGLFSNFYDNTLWRPHLYRVFRPRSRRADIHDMLNRTRTLRNRIAHHEPLVRRNLNEDYDRIGTPSVSG